LGVLLYYCHTNTAPTGIRIPLRRDSRFNDKSTDARLPLLPMAENSSHLLRHWSLNPDKFVLFGSGLSWLGKYRQTKNGQVAKAVNGNGNYKILLLFIGNSEYYPADHLRHRQTGAIRVDEDKYQSARDDGD
jgi:hypothetical protein